MRRYALLAPFLVLPGCSGVGHFLGDAFSSPFSNPNIPMTDSENLRRVLGQDPTFQPLQPEPGNVWPGPQPIAPSLEDIGQQRNTPGYAIPDSTVPGAEPGLPAGRQPRPRGSSTPPGSVQPEAGPSPSAIAPVTPPFQAGQQPRNPTGSVVQSPQGPNVDAGGTNSYRQLTTPQGPGAIMVPNGNGTSTIINPNGTVQTIPTPR